MVTLSTLKIIGKEVIKWLQDRLTPPASFLQIELVSHKKDRHTTDNLQPLGMRLKQLNSYFSENTDIELYLVIKKYRQCILFV